VQPVGVVVTAQCPVTRVEIVPNLEYVSKFLSTSFALGAVFDLPFGSEVQAKSSTSAPAESSAGLTYSRIAFSVSLSRRHNYFVNNIILPLGSVTLLCPLSAASEPDGSRMGTGDRLAYAVTLMLTAVAYKLVISSSVPQVSYLTKVETYTLVCFGFMWVNLLECALWPAVGYVLVDGVVVERISEWWYALGFVFAFALYNLHFRLAGALRTGEARGTLRTIRRQWQHDRVQSRSYGMLTAALASRREGWALQPELVVPLDAFARRSRALRRTAGGNKERAGGVLSI